MSNPSESRKCYELYREVSNDAPKAIRLLEKAISLDPKNIYAYGALVYLLRQLDRYSEAEDIAQKGLHSGNLSPEHRKQFRSLDEDILLSRQELFAQLGFTFADQGKFAEAITALKEANSLSKKRGAAEDYYDDHINQIRLGTYERKRDGKIKREKSVCFIASAVYGSPMSKEVNVLREYRDKKLIFSWHGKVFLSIYNQIGPSLAIFISQHHSIKTFVRTILLKPTLWYIQRSK